MEKKKRTLYEAMKRLEGAREWDTAVKMIQEWFYGSYVKASWCATTVCYAAHDAGLLFPKNDNVYGLLLACKTHAKNGNGTFYFHNAPMDLKQGDVLFWLWRGAVMNYASSKHVGVCVKDTPASASEIECIGGNQSNRVCVKTYNRANLYAVYRPN